MKKSVRFMASVLIIGAYLLNACTGAAPQSSNPVKAQKVDSSEVVFTGVIEEINGDQWTVNGQKVTVDISTTLDPNIKVGDVVKVEGSVSQDGVVMASKIESSTGDDNSNGNINDSNSNDINANSNDQIGNSNDNSNGNSNDNGQIGNSNGNSNDDDQIGNSNDNSNSNSNDQVDNSNDNSNGNSNDDSGGNSNSGNGNSNDDNGGNSNDNSDD